MTEENFFERDLKKPEAVGGYVSKQEVELARIELANRLIPDHRHQNTEIKTKLREVLSSLNYLANTPFMLSARASPNQKCRENMEQIEIESLQAFLDEYFILGVAVNRKGRNEAVRVAQAAMGNEQQQDDTVKKSILIH